MARKLWKLKKVEIRICINETICKHFDNTMGSISCTVHINGYKVHVEKSKYNDPFWV